MVPSQKLPEYVKYVWATPNVLKSDIILVPAPKVVENCICYLLFLYCHLDSERSIIFRGLFAMVIHIDLPWLRNNFPQVFVVRVVETEGF